MSSTSFVLSVSAMAGCSLKISWILRMEAAPCENILTESPQANIGQTSMLIYWLKATKRPSVMSPTSANERKQRGKPDDDIQKRNDDRLDLCNA